MFAQDSQVLSPLPPCSPLFIFEHPQTPPDPLTPQGTFILARTHPLPLNFYTCEI